MIFDSISEFVIRLYQLINLLSLDVVAGAIAGAFFAVSITHTHPVPAFWFCLAASVWLVYTTDHLLDGLKKKDRSSSPRHLFHFRNRSVIGAVIIILGLVTAYIALMYLPNTLILFGVILGSFTAAYLLLAWLAGKKGINYHFKEFIVAIVYVGGIWGGPILYKDQWPGIEGTAFIIIFLLLAINNLLSLSYYEESSDRADGHHSFSTIYGKGKTIRLFYINLIISVILISLLLICNPGHGVIFAGLIFLLMELVQAFIMNFRSYFNTNQRFRFIGEMVFLMPALIFLV